VRVLIDIGHPAHVHLFKHFAWDMQKRGHEIYLLEKYGFEYQSFGRKYTTPAGKIWGLVEFDIKAALAGLKFKPDIFLSHGSIYAAHAAFLMRKPHISMEDTFNFEQINLYKPFTKAILTADYDNPLSHDKKTVGYAGYHELAYLHPNRFNPDEKVLDELGVKKGTPYVIMRFVSWKATHDIGHKGMSLENKIRSVQAFEKHSRVFISSEAALPAGLEKNKIPAAPDRMHHAIAFASLLFGESSTMAEEAAMMGVPAIYLSSISTCYTTHLENRYGLLFNFSESENDQVKAMEQAVTLLQNPEIKGLWQERRKKMLSERIDVTSFMVWFVENFPESFRIMHENPDYQNRFK
jgi:predicted glycosyltransferase